MSDPEALRSELQAVAPTLWNDLTDKANSWVSSVEVRLRKDPRGAYPKTFNDPIWGDIVLYPWETILLDSPLLQRLRGVRQLGMAHLVYPGAGYDRLERKQGRGTETGTRIVIDSSCVLVSDPSRCGHKATRARSSAVTKSYSRHRWA